jgi:LmbE family N-acetylglucosaminyl deacetylase
MGSLLRLPESTRKMLITVFTESCWTFYNAPQRDRWKEIIAIRVQEDKKFADLFGCEYIHFPLADTSLRDYSPGQEYTTPPMNDPIFSEVIGRLSQLVSKLPNKAFLYIPLGIGQHVDHLIVRTAITNLCREFNQLVFYEDLPYADNYSDIEIEVLAGSIDNCLRPRLIDMEEFWSQKVQGIHIYSSQLEAHTYPHIEAYARRIGVAGRRAERFWSIGDVGL